MFPLKNDKKKLAKSGTSASKLTDGRKAKLAKKKLVKKGK